MSRLLIILACSIILALSAARAHGEAPPVIANFVKTYCFDCHSGEDSEAGFDLKSLRIDLSETNDLENWVKVLRRVRDGEMPPADYGQPGPREAKAFLDVLQPRLVRAEQMRYAAEGRSTVRRLSKAEHINALRDLLRMPQLDAGDKLPPDGLSDGFGKSSSALPFSHIQIDRYLEIADNALRAAMAPRRVQPKSKTARVWVSEVKGKVWKQRYGNANGQETLVLSQQSSYLYGALKSSNGMPLVGRKVDTTFESWTGDFAQRKPGYVLDEPPYIDAVGILNHGTREIGRDFRATLPGRYKIRLGGYAFRANHGQVQSTDRSEVVAFYSDTRLLGHVDITPKAKTHELEVWLNAGEKVSVSAASLPLWRIEPKDKKTSKRYPVVDTPAVAIQGFEMEGPLVNEWPPASHRRLFGNLPLKPIEGESGSKRNKKGDSALDYEVASSDPGADAQRLLTAFIGEAYRRPVEPADLRIPLRTFERRQSEGASFQEAMISAYASVLSSPRFVLVPMEPGLLPPHTLADRLALFLWNSPSDSALRQKVDRASGNELLKVVDEMIDDPRAERFVKHFTDHWLDLRSIGTTEPDENLYSGYTPWLKESMLKETRAFVLAMLRDDLPAKSVFDSDFTFANGALAELYGIKNVAGGDVQKITLPKDSIRGGLVTQASVMKVSANGTTTSPVVRGVYVMDRLLGDPPPPPPAAVAAVEPDLSGATTIRKLLARHREDMSCASCHRKIDPPGFALESFDVMGRFRERYHSLEKGDPVKGINRRAKPIQFKLALPVDTAGEIEGRPFENIEDFRRLVLQDERAIARNLLERLTVYATGAPIGISDQQQIEAILNKTERKGYGLRSMIHALVQSPLFRNK